MKRIYLFITTLLASSALFAGTPHITTLRFETRIDYQQEYFNKDKSEAGSGFKGKFLNFRIDGNLTEGLSYSYRQRLIKPQNDASFFDATDWISLTYSRKDWNITAGKLVVAVGGYEYNAAPIDVYQYSEYANHIACYQFGVSTGYNFNDGRDNLTFQFCESPFRKNPLNVQNKEMFGYNLMWTGNHGCFEALYSVNMLEYLPGRFINYIALGNGFTFGDFHMELDMINRAVNIKELLFKDMTLVGKFVWKATDRLKLLAKVTYDVNNSNETGDWCAAPGTDMTMVLGGLEYHPFKTYKDVRLHLNYSYTEGRYLDAAALKPGRSVIDCGVTWFMNLIKNR